MDFIDYDTFNSKPSELPAPAPPLILPLSPTKFKTLSSRQTPTETNQNTQNKTSQTAQKYAELTVNLLADSEQNSSLNESELSNKLGRILNNYEINDHSLRESLSILQEKNLDLKVLIKNDLIGVINRRKFRSGIESELLKQHFVVLREFQVIVDKIEDFGENLNRLNAINKELNIDELDKDLLKRLKDLNDQKNLTVLKKTLLDKFKQNYTLNQYEEHYLINGSISSDYFEILKKCQQIHTNCSVLLSLSNPNLGLKIMSKMTEFLELSYQRISYFISSQLDQFIKEDSIDLKLMKLSIFYISKNVKFFDQIVEKLIITRSKFIVEEFHYQLNNTAILLSGHDPLRYIGDILAFIHSLIVNELEFITNILENDESNELGELNFNELNESIPTIVNKIISSLNKPLKIRIEQILRTESDIKTLHKITNLLSLYKMMYSKQSTDSIELDSLKRLSSERIFALLKEQLKSINPEINDLLLPPDWLVSLFNESLVLFEDDIDSGEFNALTSLVIDKPLELLTHSSLDQSSTKIFQINSLDFIYSKLLPIARLSSQLAKIEDLLTTYKQELIQLQYKSLLKQSGLEIHQQLIQLIFPIEQIQEPDDYLMYSSLIENKLFQEQKLSEIGVKLHEFLPVALIEVQQSLFKISSPSIVNEIITSSSLEFLKVYDVFYRILGILYEEPLLEWSSLDVATLLGVEELYKNTLTLT